MVKAEDAPKEELLLKFNQTVVQQSSSFKWFKDQIKNEMEKNLTPCILFKCFHC